MGKIRSNVRAATRAGFGVASIPVILGLVGVQSTVAGPVFNNYTVIPNFIFSGMRRLLGIKVSLNPRAAPIVEGKPVWYVANHISTADPVVLACCKHLLESPD